ncbi:uncharacterized protein BX664DRAFT_319431 [Halteromyces radiatus]|uniref:uncharacterized protein n=1 Tax=Halteromyces radiatus TaxID=101107 RepID=UPI00221F83B2|nr:uncharacterized protein BX664DRAFT_319431 [Halteromyces radiatus]KAI8098730.1 hypothetical protein BX664DRAFT_319431 [Halteromyces radiatus]
MKLQLGIFITYITLCYAQTCSSPQIEVCCEDFVGIAQNRLGTDCARAPTSGCPSNTSHGCCLSVANGYGTMCST